MLDFAEQTLAILRPKYPGWHLWTVKLYGRGWAWCAKPAGSEVATINADSPETLIAAIASAELDSGDRR